MRKLVSSSLLAALKHIGVMMVLAMMGALLFFGNGLGEEWALVFSNKHYFHLFVLILGVSLATVSMVDYITVKLNGYTWANRGRVHRFWIQMAIGVVGLGGVMYGLEVALFEWALMGVFGFSPDMMSALIFLLYMLLANMAVLYFHGVLQLTPTGAVPKNSYLTHLLTLDGEVPEYNIRFCYHYMHKMNRVRLRNSAFHWDLVLQMNLTDAEKKLNADEFMRIAPDIIIHQSAIVDDGKKLANRNKRVQLVEPFEKMDSDGRIKQISEVSISRRKVKQFDHWRANYRMQQVKGG